MSLTFEDILKFNIPSNFGLDEDSDFSDTVDNLVRQIRKIDKEVKFTWGASKFIIFLNKKEVVKIPFCGAFRYDYEEDEYYFDDFECEDYCDVEAYLYDMAVEYGVEKFFAKTVWAGKTNTIPVYKSERVFEFYYSDELRKASKDSYDKVKENNLNGKYYPISREWVAKAFDYYTEAEIDSLFNFIADMGINDLHDDNLGFRKDGSPVILDYSGFNEG